MIRGYPLLVFCLLSTTNCGRLVDADGSYLLTESGSSSQTPGSSTSSGMGGADGGAMCTTNADCPESSVLCVSHECINGVCRLQNTAEGQPCTANEADVCDGQGQCVQCTQAAHCTSIVEEQCTRRACVENTCQTQYLSQQSPAGPALQQPGDCKIVVCDGFGGTKPINDDTDTPNDDNGCTTDSCLNGSEVHAKVATGTPCGIIHFAILRDNASAV